jgi:hypothetical protein
VQSAVLLAIAITADSCDMSQISIKKWHAELACLPDGSKSQGKHVDAACLGNATEWANVNLQQAPCPAAQ